MEIFRFFYFDKIYLLKNQNIEIRLSGTFIIVQESVPVNTI